MVSGVSERRGSVDRRFIRPLPKTTLTKLEMQRRYESALYLTQSVSKNKLIRCKSVEEFQALIREALIYLVSENDALNVRRPNFPQERIHVFQKARKLEDCLPFELMDIVQAALQDNRLIYIGDTAFGEGEADPEIRARRSVVYSIAEALIPKRTPRGIIVKDTIIERGFLEALGISREQVPLRIRLADGSIQECPSLLVLPFVSVRGTIDNLIKEEVGGAVVVGLKPEFLNPRVDLEPLRLLGIEVGMHFNL
ncbi:hypothetical protein HZC35_05985 [Candidatus Saganbacteria bacterium]|nr:hypothetical protein [Candidatus Saganbacteria bacterium]